MVGCGGHKSATSNTGHALPTTWSESNPFFRSRPFPAPRIVVTDDGINKYCGELVKRNARLLYDKRAEDELRQVHGVRDALWTLQAAGWLSKRCSKMVAHEGSRS